MRIGGHQGHLQDERKHNSEPNEKKKHEQKRGVSLAWAYHSPTNVHIYSLVAEHISCSVMSLLV
jgi:hypothetical protein